jgi:hypothetical protein
MLARVCSNTSITDNLHSMAFAILSSILEAMEVAGVLDVDDYRQNNTTAALRQQVEQSGLFKNLPTLMKDASDQLHNAIAAGRLSGPALDFQHHSQQLAGCSTDGHRCCARSGCCLCTAGCSTRGLREFSQQRLLRPLLHLQQSWH